jgi:hypothetical protein
MWCFGSSKDSILKMYNWYEKGGGVLLSICLYLYE